MKLREFADLLTDRDYGHEITEEEEALAKELGFVVVFGYSDDNAELRGAIDDEIGCYNGGLLTHKKLRGTILAEWCPEDIDCSWHFSSDMPSEKFYVFEDGDLYCVGIVIDNNGPKPQTNADRIRAMSDEELAKWIDWLFGRCEWCDTDKMATDDCNDVECTSCILEWLKQPAEEGDGNG